LATRCAVDIGGTFTDLVYLDEASGDVGLAKSSTTPGRFEQGVINAINALTEPPLTSWRISSIGKRGARSGPTGCPVPAC
jgi:N-methylhydantoinase A/oxoprolinase/acetone carboxylase beta subunit